jgi:hypothetical protein
MMVVRLAHIAVHGTSASPLEAVHPNLAEDGSICILVSAPTACNILISLMSVSGPSLMSMVSMIFIATPQSGPVALSV